MANKIKKVNIIVPVFNEAEMLPLFYDEAVKVTSEMKSFDFEFVFVNDGSTDNTLEILKEIADKDSLVKYISFSRNFGKEAAILAGLRYAGSNSKADYTILMDGDLEHPPALIPSMLKAVDEDGFKAAGAKRKPKFFSKMFVNINNKMSNIKIEKGATDFMCMDKDFVRALLSLTETQRFSKGLFAWVGYEIKWFDYEETKRAKGKSKWSFGKLSNYATDGLTSFSIAPLRVVTVLGIIICAGAFIYIIATLIKTFITGIDVPGYVTTLCAVLFLGGIVVLAIGILGGYIGRIYLESKNRPLYILKETNIDDDRKSDNK